MNININKSYVRAFFDAEGHVRTDRNNSVSVAIGNTWQEIIKEIGNFFDSLGIKYGYSLSKRKNPKHKNCLYIKTYSYEDAIKFYEKIGCTHPKKVKKFEEISNYYYECIIPKRERIIKDKKMVTKLCNEGKTHYRIQKILPHLSQSQIDGFCSGKKHIKV
jgi:hypothetical protein